MCVLQPRGEAQYRPQKRDGPALLIRNDSTASSKERKENDASDLAVLKDWLDSPTVFVLQYSTITHVHFVAMQMQHSEMSVLCAMLRYCALRVTGSPGLLRLGSLW